MAWGTRCCGETLDCIQRNEIDLLVSDSVNLMTGIQANSVAIMQPYVFPYLGYFHLIEAVDLFVFYDDVHFIKKGWIHRNRLLNQGEPLLFTVPIHKPSQNRLILETVPNIDDKWRKTFAAQLQHCYGKAPNYTAVAPAINQLFAKNYPSIAELAIESIQTVYGLLGLTRHFVRSSEEAPETKGMQRAERLVAICRKYNASRYVNSPGGAKIYDKGQFQDLGIELKFIKSSPSDYQQNGDTFVAGLSIIDLLMHNPMSWLIGQLQSYCLE